MHYNYCLLDTLIGTTHRYGIAAMEGAAILDAFLDLSLDRGLVTELVTQCNVLGLDLIHLPDVVEDFFVEATR